MLVYGIANEFFTVMIKLAIHPCQTKQLVYNIEVTISESRISESLLYLHVRYNYTMQCSDCENYLYTYIMHL